MKNSVASWTSVLRRSCPATASRAKSVGITLKIWSGIPANRVPLRDRAIALLPTISGQERVWLHWGMTSLAYPFFRDTAEVVGRLLTLQDDFTTAQVQERLLKKWGDRATTKEAAQKLLHTLVDWEVLRSTKTKGHFLLVARMSSPSIGTPALALGIVAGRQLGRGGRGTAAPPLARDVPVPAVDRAIRPPKTRRLPSPSSGTRHGYGLGAGPETLAAAEALEDSEKETKARCSGSNPLREQSRESTAGTRFGHCRSVRASRDA